MSNEVEATVNEVKTVVPEETHQHKFLEHFKKAGKKLGFWGGVLLVLHILFHVVEVLILPALLVWLGIKS